MSGVSPCILIHKLVGECSDEGIRNADLDLRSLLADAFPSIQTNEWRPAGRNDVDVFFMPQDLTSAGMDVSVSFRGTRISSFATYVLVQIDVFQGNRAAYDSRLYARDLEFVKSMLQSPPMNRGTIVIGQSGRDLREKSVISGARSDVFSYLLGISSGLGRLDWPREFEGSPHQVPWLEIANELDSALGSSELVSVSGLSAASFLRDCFRELEAVTSRADFDGRYGKFGVFWHPRSPIKWSAALVRFIRESRNKTSLK